MRAWQLAFSHSHTGVTMTEPTAPPKKAPGRRRSGFGSGGPQTDGLAVRLNAARKKAAEVGSVARFVASELWAASPPFTVALLAVSWTSGVTPLLQVWAIRGLVNALMRPA